MKFSKRVKLTGVPQYFLNISSKHIRKLLLRVLVNNFVKRHLLAFLIRKSDLAKRVISGNGEKSFGFSSKEVADRMAAAIQQNFVPSYEAIC